MNGLKDQHALVLGLGVSGLAMARWCAAQGARVTVADTRGQPPQLQALREQLPQARFAAGPLDAALLDGDVRLVCRSPGLAPAAIAAVAQAAHARGVPVQGELDLFSAALDGLRDARGYAPKVIAITGTNGKTTVTALTGQLLQRAGIVAAVSGNIGPSLLDTLHQRLLAGDLPAAWVLELSSFQLHACAGFEPTAAAVLNITQDHLDWHGDMDAYVAAKARVFGARSVMVLNRDDALVAAMRPPAPTKPARGAAREPPRQVITFGAGLPAAPGDFGIETAGGMDWLVRAFEAGETRRPRKDSQHAEADLHLQRLMPADALHIRGRHNALNALAALALATGAGCPLGPLLYGLREYRGEPHRVQSIGVLDGIEYFDDSKGTNVGATIAALQGLGGGRKLVVILGGDGKGQDFAPLVDPVARHARAVVLIGRDAPAIRAALTATAVEMIDAPALPEAVSSARAHARPGDAVLLSPACASLDMFRDYAHRAQVFCDAVRELARASGVELEVAP